MAKKKEVRVESVFKQHQKEAENTVRRILPCQHQLCQESAVQLTREHEDIPEYIDARVFFVILSTYSGSLAAGISFSRKARAAES